MAGLPAILDAGPNLKQIYDYLDKCSAEIDGCEFCNFRRECEDYCDRHLYNFSEVTPAEFSKHIAAITRRCRSRKKIQQPAARECNIEFPKFRHRESSLVCY